MHREDFVEEEVREEFVAEVLDIIRDHHKKHPNRRMTQKDLQG